MKRIAQIIVPTFYNLTVTAEDKKKWRDEQTTVLSTTSDEMLTAQIVKKRIQGLIGDNNEHPSLTFAYKGAASLVH